MGEKPAIDGSPSPYDRNEEITEESRKHWRRLRNVVFSLGLLGAAGGVGQSEMVQTEWRKIAHADPERAGDLAQRVMELSDAVEENGPEIFEAKLDFHLQVLLNAGESEDRVAKTKQFFTDLFDRFQAITKIEKDKKKVLFGMFQSIGRYVPGKARISDIANENQGNCDAMVQALTLLVSGIYPELPLKVQFFGASDVKKTEAHSRALVNIDGKWYSLEGEPVEVPEADMKGTVLVEGIVFEALFAFGNNEEQLIAKTNAKLVSEEESKKNPDDGGFGQGSNTLFDVSVFTENAIQTYDEGGGPSQPESLDAYKERMELTPDFGVINFHLVDYDDMHKKEYTSVPLPEEIKQKALEEGELILESLKIERPWTKLPLYDVRKFLEDNYKEVKRILVQSIDREPIDLYYDNQAPFHFDVVASNSTIFYFQSSNHEPNKIFDNPSVKVLKFNLRTDKLKTKDFFSRNFDDLESFDLFYSGKVRLPNFGDKLESASLIQEIDYPQDIVSLQDLQPLFGKNLKRLKITVYAYGVNVQRIPFSSKDLRDKNIVAEGGDIQIHFENQ